MDGRWCANCEEAIEGDPVTVDGVDYCCSGCAGGGPCICPPRRRTAEPAAEPAPEAAAAGASVAVMLRAGRFIDQEDLLAFAEQLEGHPALSEVSLTRANIDAAWFALRAASTDEAMRAIRELEGFDLQVTARESLIEAQIVYQSVEEFVEQSDQPAPGSDPVLPLRQRMRLSSDETARPPAETGEQEPAPPTPDEKLTQPEPGAPVQHITLLARPFGSYGELDRFQTAVRALPGVADARVSRFDRGALQLVVDYAGATPFEERLRELEGFTWSPVSSAPGQLEIAMG